MGGEQALELEKRMVKAYVFHSWFTAKGLESESREMLIKIEKLFVNRDPFYPNFLEELMTLVQDYGVFSGKGEAEMFLFLDDCKLFENENNGSFKLVTSMGTFVWPNPGFVFDCYDY